MSYLAYKVLHVLGILMVFAALGGTVVHAANRGDRNTNKLRGAVGLLHGVGLLLILVAGFGMIARLALGGVPGWAWAKVVLWIVFGGLAVVPYRRPEWNGLLIWLVPILGTVAAYLAIYKPF